MPLYIVFCLNILPRSIPRDNSESNKTTFIMLISNYIYNALSTYFTRFPYVLFSAYLGVRSEPVLVT